jgi:predicted ATP-grasp superfamily ATP-dependent carboligase
VEACVRQSESVDLAEGTVLVAFPAEGFAATLAAAYLVDEFRLRQVGVLDCEAVPSVAIVERGKVVPPIRLLVGRDKGKAAARHPLAVFLSEVPLPEESFRAVAAAILEWCVGNRVATVIAMESVATPGDPGEAPSSRLWGVANHPGFTARLGKAGLPLAQEGVVGGVTGSLLTQALDAPLAVVGLVETSRGAEPGIRGASALVEFLAKFLRLPVRLDRLHRETERFQKHLKEVEQRRFAADDPSEPATRDFI